MITTILKLDKKFYLYITVYLTPGRGVQKHQLTISFLFISLHTRSVISCFVTNYRERGIFECPAPLMWIPPSHLTPTLVGKCRLCVEAGVLGAHPPAPLSPSLVTRNLKHPQSAPGPGTRGACAPPTPSTTRLQTPDTGDRGRRRINEKFTSRLPVAALSNSSDSATPIKGREGCFSSAPWFDTTNQKLLLG